MTEKERKAAASKVYQAVGEAEMKVREMMSKAKEKVKAFDSVCDDEDKAVNVRAIFKVKRFLEQMNGAWCVISNVSPIVERLRWDGEADQFEELLEMVEDTKSDAYHCAYEIERIYFRVFGK